MVYTSLDVNLSILGKDSNNLVSFNTIDNNTLSKTSLYTSLNYMTNQFAHILLVRCQLRWSTCSYKVHHDLEQQQTTPLLPRRPREYRKVVQ